MPAALLDANVVLPLRQEIPPSPTIRRPQQSLAFFFRHVEVDAWPKRNVAFTLGFQSTQDDAVRLCVGNRHADQVLDVAQVSIVSIAGLAASVPPGPEQVRERTKLWLLAVLRGTLLVPLDRRAWHEVVHCKDGSGTRVDSVRAIGARVLKDMSANIQMYACTRFKRLPDSLCHLSRIACYLAHLQLRKTVSGLRADGQHRRPLTPRGSMSKPVAPDVLPTLRSNA